MAEKTILIVHLTMTNIGFFPPKKKSESRYMNNSNDERYKVYNEAIKKGYQSNPESPASDSSAYVVVQFNKTKFLIQTPQCQEDGKH